MSYRINAYITVEAVNCTLVGTGQGDAAILTISDIKTNGSSKLSFTSTYPWAIQNWFHFNSASKNVYFDNYVKVENPGGASYTNSITFTAAPSGNTGGDSSPVSTNFDLVNKNGRVNDPTLTISW